MSGFVGIDAALRKALSDLSLGYPLIGENTNFNPQSLTSDIWIEAFQLPSDVVSGMKSGNDAMDENQGIFQVSVFTKDTNSGNSAVMAIVDSIASEFTHGKEYTDAGSNETVFIQNSSRNNGRVEGAFYQVDLSITWTAYIGR